LNWFVTHSHIELNWVVTHLYNKVRCGAKDKSPYQQADQKLLFVDDYYKYFVKYRLICVCDVTPPYVWHVSQIYCESSVGGVWLIRMYSMTHEYVQHDSFICIAAVAARVRNVTHSYLRHALFIRDSFIFASCPIRDLFVFAICLIQKVHSRVIRFYDMTHLWLIRTMVCATWLIPYVWHDAVISGSHVRKS